MIGKTKYEMLEVLRCNEPNVTSDKFKIAVEILNPRSDYVWLPDERIEAHKFMKDLAHQTVLENHIDFMDEHGLWQKWDDFRINP